MACQVVASFSPAASAAHHSQQLPAVSSLFSQSRNPLRFPRQLHLVPPPSHNRILPVVQLAMDVPDYLPLQWSKTMEDKPLGPCCDMTAEQAIGCQLEALRNNDHPHVDYGVEVMYMFAGFDPFQRSTYFGPFFDLGQFERFRRIFHHATFRVLLGHKEVQILSSLAVDEHCFKQRVWVRGARPDEEGIFEFTLFQRVGGCWDGYWLTHSLRHDGDGISGGIAY